MCLFASTYSVYAHASVRACLYVYMCTCVWQLFSVLSSLLYIPHLCLPFPQLDTGDSTHKLSPDKAKGLAFERTENFSAVTAIISVVVVALILVVFGLSWVLFTMDPAKDTVVYRLMPGRVKTE